MKKNQIKFIRGITLLLLFEVLFGYTFAEILDNGVEVEPSTELTYYLSVKYDGIDVLGRTSSDSAVAEVNSGVIYVEDKIPEGLTFDGFVTTENGSIGSVERNNPLVPCTGIVINDTSDTGNSGAWNNNNTEFTYHGLHYDATTRTVSFRVKNLKAGCVLNVGVKTITPATVDDPNTVQVETRRDFYNYAIAKELLITSFSNVVHAFMGNKNETLYTVTYQYVNGTSANAPALPPTMSYAAGSTVGVAPNVKFDGYNFLGWTSNDVTISNGKFTMPSSNVTITGSFSQTTAHKVTYSISGTAPDGYVVPLEKNYYPNTYVYLDSLSVGDVFNGYRFLGWTSNDVTITDGYFEMPNSNVSIVGTFEPVQYNLSYQFLGDVKPDNSESLLPSTTQHSEGASVTLSSISDVSGYKFLGWHSPNTFTMPNKNVVVSGEWQRFNGEFEPSISIEVLDEKSYYRVGDTISYRIAVTNNDYYTINNVIIKENNSNVHFVSDSAYTIQDNLASIDYIYGYNTVYLYAEYTVTGNDSGSFVNEVELIGALADDDYILKEQDYVASVTSYLQSKIRICATVNGVDVGNSFRIKVSNNNFENWVVLKKDECMNVYVDPGTYRIFEVVPQEYRLIAVTGNLSANNTDLTVALGNDYQVNFINKFKNKKFMHAFGEVINEILGGE